MPWSYRHNPTLELVEVELSGRVTSHDLQESSSELIALEKEKGLTRFLVDTSEMELAASLIDVFNLPAKLYPEEEADRSARVAVILPVSAREREAVRFYETACRNRGWDAQVFTEREEAIVWLTRSASSDAPDAGDGS